MAKRNLRLEYSGYVIFAARVISVATGLIFQYIVAIATSKHEYDIWFNLNDVIVYFTLLSGLLPFWAMRFTARGKEGSLKTGTYANLAISIAATLIYLPLVQVITSALKIESQFVLFYYLIAVQIMELHSIGILESCLQAKMPHAIGYGLLVQQFSKIVLAYAVIIQLHQPLLGAVLATITGFLIQTGYYIKLLAEEFRQKVRWEYVAEWLKGSIVNVYNVAGNQIAAFIFILLFTYGGDGGRGIYGAAATVTNVITYSSFLAYALYPKLLAERRNEDITTSLKMVLMFAIPMTLGAITMSDSYITILKKGFAGSGSVLIVLAVDSFVSVMSGLFGYVVFGMEKVDEEGKISFKELAKSRLFIVFSLPYFHSAITLPTAYYFLNIEFQLEAQGAFRAGKTLYGSGLKGLVQYAQHQPMQAALYVGIINASARFLMFLVLLAIVSKMTRIDIPWRKIAGYILASGVMAAFLLVMPHSTRLSLILGETAVGGLIYLATLMVVDKDARKLPATVWQEVRKRGKGG